MSRQHIERKRGGYPYDPLPRESIISETAGLSIRIATIYPGSFDDEIRITLRTVLFRNSYYEALSYVWGSEDDSAAVVVSTNRGGVIGPSGSLYITRNLEVALRHLRYPNRKRPIWIDAVCIDQSNDAEKGPQVAMMGEIFRRAQRVVIWLGPEENNSSRCLHLMEDLGSQINADTACTIMSPAVGCRDVSLADNNIALPWDCDDLCSAYHLLSRPWFNRLWARQEILLADQDSAMVACGKCAIPWRNFRRELYSRLRQIRRFLFHPPALSLSQLGAHLVGSSCRDARDRLYAALSLMDEASRNMVGPPDYTKPAERIYVEATIAYIRYYDRLDILGRCGAGGNTFGPSWVPAWSRDASVLDRNQWASGQLLAFYEVSPGSDISVLRAAGVLVDATQALSSTHDRKSTAVDAAVRFICESFHQLGYDETHLDDSYVGGGNLAEAYTTMLSRGFFREKWRSYRSYLPGTDESIRAVRNWLLRSDERAVGLSQEEQKFISYATFDVPGVLFRLATGHIGRGPPEMRKGDEVFVLLGCHDPMVLRPSEQNAGRYTVVGPCFVSGLNEGQALLGPMPASKSLRTCSELGVLMSGWLSLSSYVPTSEWAGED